VPPVQKLPPANTTGRLRAVGGAGARRVLGAYSGEHGVYGIVLVTAVIAVGWDDETDLDVLVFLLGTVVVFWLAHIYSGVVASRGAAHREPLLAAVRTAMKHASGMLIAMLIPAILLSTAVLGWVEEWTAYFMALGSGLLMLAIIGYLNAARNRSPWPWRVAGVLSTTLLGALVIGLSIMVH
jgi:positive regulator of sigma E activity